MAKNDALAYTFLVISLIVIIIIGIFSVKLIMNQEDNSADYVEIPVSYMEPTDVESHTTVVLEDKEPEPEPVKPIVVQPIVPIVVDTTPQLEEVTCSSKVRAAENDLDDAFDDLDNARDDLYGAYEDLEDANADLIKAQNASDDRATDRAENDIEDAEDDIDKFENDVEDAQDAVEDMIKDLDDAEQDCDVEMRSADYNFLKEKFDEATDCERVVDDAGDAVNDAEDDYDDVDEELSDAEDDLKKAEDAKAALINATDLDELKADDNVWDAEQWVDRWERRLESMQDLVDFYDDMERDFNRECD